MKEEIVKIESVPQKLNELEKRKEELTKLVSETSLITINGIKDTEGFKTADKNRKLVKKEISDIEKSRKEIKAPVLKIGSEIDDIAKELTAILTPEKNRLDEITTRHLADIEAEKEREIQKRKEKIRNRLGLISSLKPNSDGFKHHLSFEKENISINNDEIELFTDEQFESVVLKFNKISSLILQEKHRLENRLNDRRTKLKPYFKYTNLTDDKLTVITEEEFNIELKNCIEAKEVEDKKEKELKEKQEAEAALLKKQQEQQEKQRIELEKQQEELRKQQAIIDAEKKRIKEQAEKIAMEEQQKKDAEIAKQKAIEEREKAEKEAEEKRKLDIERQKEFEPIKEKAISFIRNHQDSLVSICDDFENDEARELMFDFEQEINSTCEEFINKFIEL